MPLMPGIGSSSGGGSKGEKSMSNLYDRMAGVKGYSPARRH